MSRRDLTLVENMTDINKLPRRGKTLCYSGCNAPMEHNLICHNIFYQRLTPNGVIVSDFMDGH